MKEEDESPSVKFLGYAFLGVILFFVIMLVLAVGHWVCNGGTQ